MATETQAIRENYELGVLAGEARREAEIIELLEDDDYDLNITTVQDNFWAGYWHAVARIKGEG